MKPYKSTPMSQTPRSGNTPVLTSHRLPRTLALGGAFLGALTMTSSYGLSSAAAGTKQASSAPSGAGIVRVTTWFTSGPDFNALNQIDAAFEKKYPDIAVDLVTAPNNHGPYETLLETSVDAHTADVVMMDGTVNPLPHTLKRSTESPTQFWSLSGTFQPLNGESWLKNYQPSLALASETHQGKVYGVAFTAWNNGVFYNKAIFKKYHLAVPVTFTQFLHICQVLKANGITPLFDGLGAAGPTYLSFMYEPLMAELWGTTVPNGNLAAAIDNGTTKWTAPQFTTVLNRLHQASSYLEPGYAGVSYTDIPGALADDKAAMMLDGSWDVPSVLADNPHIQIGYFPFPGSDNAAQNKPVLSTGDTFSVLSDAPNKAGGLKWLGFFSSPQAYRIWIDESGGTPTERLPIHYDTATAKVIGPSFGTGYNSNSILPAFPPSGPYYDQDDNYADLLLDVANGSKTPLQVQRTYQQGWKS